MKAGECKTVLPWVLRTMEQYHHRLGEGGAFLVEAGRSLLSFLNIVNVAPSRLSVTTCQSMIDHLKRFATMCVRAGVPSKPKLHMLTHVPARALGDGNPSLHATWLDESWSRELARVSHRAHRRVWEQRILTSFELATAAPRTRGADSRG